MGLSKSESQQLDLELSPELSIGSFSDEEILSCLEHRQTLDIQV
jgi:hypothetical protein